MRRHERGADPGQDFIRTIEIKNKDGTVIERKDVVSAKGLLHLAHKERLSKIRTTVVQSPSKENGETAIVVVLVVTQRGAFTALGDANPRNVNARIAPHFIRMAETRALARALRSALDVGAVAIEELEDEVSFADAKHEERPARETPRVEVANDNSAPPNGERARAPSARTASVDGDCGASQDADAMSDPQKRLLYRIAFEQGHEGDAARGWLLEQFRVESFAEIRKREASRFIDRFRQKTGDNGSAAAE
jgi:hypothetical protein